MTADKIRLEWVKPPLQARSQQTLERLLDAAEAIICEKGIDKATVADIARRGDSSVGAFYSRFADKEALLKCVLQRFNDQALATAEAVLEPSRWATVDFRDALEAMMHFMLEMLRERRQLVLALMTRAPTDPQLSAFGEHLQTTITRLMHALIEHRHHQLGHHDPETAIQLAVWLVLSAVENRTIHERPNAAPASGCAPRLADETVAKEVTEMVMRYLDVRATQDLRMAGDGAQSPPGAYGVNAAKPTKQHVKIQ